MTCFDHNILLNAGALLARPHQVLGFGFRARGSLAAGSSLANTAALFPEPQRVCKKMRMRTWTSMRVSIQCFAVGRLEGYKLVEGVGSIVGLQVVVVGLTGEW